MVDFKRLNKVFDGKLESLLGDINEEIWKKRSLTAETATTRDIVAKLWNLCNVLRDDGITYTDYVTELTFLLFLKMLAETGQGRRLPEGYRWSELAKREGLEQLEYYKRLLARSWQSEGQGRLSLAIFTDAQTKLAQANQPQSAHRCASTSSIGFPRAKKGLAISTKGLLEKNAAEKKSGAGQYFTPRP